MIVDIVVVVQVETFGMAGEDARKDGGCLGKHVRRHPELQDRLAASRLRVIVGKFENGIAMGCYDNFLNLPVRRDTGLARLHEGTDVDQLSLDSLVVAKSDLVARELPMSATSASATTTMVPDVRIEDRPT